MYNEKSGKINYLGIILRVILAILVLLLSIKLIMIIINYPKNKKAVDLSKELETIESVAKDYFKDDLLPVNSGDSKKVYLNELVDKKMIKEIKHDKSSCDMKKSYVEIVKLDNEYQYKTYLLCECGEDLKNTFVPINKETTTTTTTTKKVTTKSSTKVTTKSTTKKTTTTTTRVKVKTVSYECSEGTLYNDKNKGNICIIKATITNKCNKGYIFTPTKLEWTCPISAKLCKSDNTVASYNTCISEGCSVNTIISNYNNRLFADTDSTCANVGSNTIKGTCLYDEFCKNEVSCKEGYILYKDNADLSTCYKDAKTIESYN